MHIYLRSTLPTARLAAGLALVTAGALLSAGGHLLPGALLLAAAGTTAVVHLHRPRRVQAPDVGPAARAPLVPTQRRAPQPRTGAGHQAVAGTGTAHPLGPGHDGPAPVPPGAGTPTDLRVLPHGALPRQRRPSAGS
ncbi:hypothetical protein J1G42_06125 [Cellulomonas sp. zg-ZUI222]|uniref:Uncharacterized protein n=1 Tax=Cellulomonas wangleii TaxID=2816956 RepID=A0ABX8D3T1_9CELL|nr:MULTISPECIES: hypothetical protein [Cellulomonas]MBO0899537.1 hypothetical protein [Cellulomonas sp. zg-ZUI22]MBO0920400.1 hypothetical protein [Cellulomonas wangleii]MBO0923182.1 hypothetical protein [Cellulomonas wangleii]QVI61555.1 hypothetical protein KG103_13915 [Cellulomonas wangleii]